MGEDSAAPADTATPNKSVGMRRVIGTVLSLVIAPGVGHLLLGMNRRALAWLGGMTLALLLTPFSFWTMFLGTFGVRIGSAVDLWICARNLREVPQRASALRWPLGFCILSLALSFGVRNLWAESFFIPASSMAPTLLVGDYIMTSKYDTSPAPGEVVVFVYPCDPRKDFVKRVVAVEGDTVEVRCDQLYINGSEIKRTPSDEDCSYWDLDMVGWAERGCTLYRESLGGHSYQVIHDPRPSEAIVDMPGMHDFPDLHVPSCQDSMGGLDDVTASALGTIVDNNEAPTGVCGPSQSYRVPKGHFFVMGDNRDNSSDSRVWGAVPNSAIRGKAAYVWWSKQQAANWERFGLSVR